MSCRLHEIPITVHSMKHITHIPIIGVRYYSGSGGQTQLGWKGKILGGLRAKNFLECVAKCGRGLEWQKKFYRVDGIKHFREWMTKQSVGMVCQKDII